MTIKESRDVCLSGVVTLSDSPRTTDSHRVAKHFSWCLRQESNLYLALRRRLFYPLNYGGLRSRFSHAAYQRHDQIMSSAFSLPDCARSVNRWAIR